MRMLEQFNNLQSLQCECWNNERIYNANDETMEQLNTLTARRTQVSPFTEISILF